MQRQPDIKIAEIFDETTRKYNRRTYYTTQGKEFAAELGGSPNAQLQRSNLIRAYFIANDRRLLTERPAWMPSGQAPVCCSGVMLVSSQEAGDG